MVFCLFEVFRLCSYVGRLDKVFLGVYEFLGDVGGVRKGRKDGMVLVSFFFVVLEVELVYF